MRQVLHNGLEVYRGRSVDIPKVYKAVTGNKLNIKEWQASLGKLDGLDLQEWLKVNNVEIKCYDSIFSN